MGPHTKNVACAPYFSKSGMAFTQSLKLRSSKERTSTPFRSSDGRQFSTRRFVTGPPSMNFFERFPPQPR